MARFGVEHSVVPSGDLQALGAAIKDNTRLVIAEPPTNPYLYCCDLKELSTLVKARPYMIVINLILGAVLTTPEVFTQVLMAVPLQILFEISVFVAWYWERQEKKHAEAASIDI